jgi:hypothetical protein
MVWDAGPGNRLLSVHTVAVPLRTLVLVVAAFCVVVAPLETSALIVAVFLAAGLFTDLGVVMVLVEVALLT